MKHSYISVILLIFVIFVSGCIQTEVRVPSPQGMTKIAEKQEIPAQNQNEIKQTDEQTENELIQNLSKIYNDYHSVNISKIDCKNPEYYKTDLMNLSIKNWNNEYYKTQTAMWYPSLDEGRIGNVLFDLKNVGCTKIDPVYGSIVILNNKIVFSSSENKILLSDSMYPNGLYPEDWMMGNLPVSGNNFEPLTVKATGNYIIWIYFKNKNNNHMVAIDRINLTMS